MKIIIPLVLFLVILSIPAFAGNLKCSKNGTEIIYVNGMNNKESEAKATKKKITDLINPIKPSIDSNGNVSVTNVYNAGLGIGNDIIEYVIDRARLVGISDPW